MHVKRYYTLRVVYTHLEFPVMLFKGLHHHQDCLQHTLQSPVVAVEAVHAATHVHHQTDALWKQLRRAKLGRVVVDITSLNDHS